MSDFVGAIGGKLFELILTPVLLLVAGMVVQLIKKQLQKIGIEIDQAEEAHLRELALKGARAVEEMARRDPSLRGQLKADVAAGMVLDKMPKLQPAEVSAAVDAAVTTVRAEGGKGPVPSTPATFGLPRTDP